MPDAQSEMRLLLITGAGASRNLSLLVDEPLPLMGDWCDRLRTKIGPDLSDMTTLSQAKTGVEFEETLGALFRWLETLEDGQRFAGMAREAITNNITLQGQFQQLVRNAQTNSGEFVELLHASLFDEFGPERVDSDKAAAAYGSLFRAITGADEASPPRQLVCATTNYDRSLEMALEQLGPTLRTGFTPQLYRSPSLEPRGLGEFCDGEPALIYLHGAVGWHRTEQGGFITSMPADQGYNRTLGRPAVLYPGPDKDIAHVETVELWQEFELALQEATHILVVGHALNDAHLVAAMRKSPGSVCVTYHLHHGEDNESRNEAQRDAQQRIQQQLPRAVVVGVEFGPEFEVDQAALTEWLS